MVGLAMHIGSQITEIEPFRKAYARMYDLTFKLRSDGFNVERLDLGGGLGIPYGETKDPLFGPVEYAKMVSEIFTDFDGKIIFEPGRVIAGNAGILVTRVIHLKKGATRDFAVVDAAMNDLARPSLYDAFHEIVPIRMTDENTEKSTMT